MSKFVVVFRKDVTFGYKTSSILDIFINILNQNPNVTYYEEKRIYVRGYFTFSLLMYFRTKFWCFKDEIERPKISYLGSCPNE